MPEREITIDEPDCGLRGFLVIDDTTLGPAAGGIRTMPYESEEAAIADARALARAMTIKCALGGLDAGGGKLVLIDHPGLEREQAFARIGKLVESLGGAFRTAGDYGTTSDDLAVMAQYTGWVHDFTHDLADSVARGAIRSMQAAATATGRESLQGLHVAVQGCGFIGAAVARALAAEGAVLSVSDVIEPLALATARSIGAHVIAADELMATDVDVLSPCAIGEVLDERVAEEIQAWAVCGAANNILATPEAGDRLHERGTAFVPDTISSCGGVIEGIGLTVMGLEDRGPLIDRLYDTALDVLRRSRLENRPPTGISEEIAFARIREAKA